MTKTSSMSNSTPRHEDWFRQTCAPVKASESPSWDLLERPRKKHLPLQLELNLQIGIKSFPLPE